MGRQLAVCVFLSLVAVGVAEHDVNIAKSLDRLREISRVKRVSGSSPVTAGAFPWLVSIKCSVGWLGREYWCGGSVINGMWVLTAAHCVMPKGSTSVFSPNRCHVRAGEIDRTVGMGEWWRNWFGRMFGTVAWRANLHATKIIVHPGYDQNNKWYNDIALIKVEANLAGKPGVSAVPLAASTASDPPAGQDLIFKGWGPGHRGGSMVNIARSAVLPAVSDAKCRRYYGIQATHRLCAGSTQQLRRGGLYAGDSGGPLVSHVGNTWTQVGIASFTAIDMAEEYPGVFTLVSAYRNWIDQTLRSN